jgi:outer membrane protein OmpA-like peptidoglycan-associated protein
MKRIAPIFCGLALLLHAAPAPASELSKDGIVCALDPKCAKPLARSFSRGVSTTGDTGETPLSVNLYVNFAYDSTDLTSDARITLDRLGAALGDRRLDDFSFMIAGHTDAKGGVEYNRSLSERRAEAVRQYMVAQFGIPADRLQAKGFGKSQLLDSSRPEDGINRRVQVVNMTASSRR